MKYIDVEWHHESVEDPSRMISEIDNDNFESRKIELFKNGRVGIATDRTQTLDTRLGEMEVPTLDEINSNTEFTGKEISESEFGALWEKYVHSDS